MKVYILEKLLYEISFDPGSYLFYCTLSSIGQEILDRQSKFIHLVTGKVESKSSLNPKPSSKDGDIGLFVSHSNY